MSSVPIKDIKALGREIVLKHPGGIRFKDIVAQIMARYPNAMRTTVEAQIANALVSAFPTEITKPSRGLYLPLSGSLAAPPPLAATPATRSEEEFYEPFADYLQNDLDEATAAVGLGGSAFKAKWGTPDVVGVYRPLTSDLVKFTPEIIAAEVKVEPSQPVVAFGQAIAYRLFATRAYVVMPTTMTPEDQTRLESLCMLFGIGLVMFDPTNPQDPRFEIRVRAQRFTPDMFFVNDFARRMHEAYPDKFSKIFP